MVSRVRPHAWLVALLFLALLAAGAEEDDEGGTQDDSGEGDKGKKPTEKHPGEKEPGAKEVFLAIFRVVCYILGWIPWFVLFLSAFEGSIVPKERFDKFWGAPGRPTQPAPGLDGMLKYMVIIGAMAFYMSAVVWLGAQPAKVGWKSFPDFCVQPRGFYGFLHIHQAPFYHINRMQFAYSSFAAWFIGPLLLNCGKRTFVFSTFFSGFMGYFLYWCVGPKGDCVAGLSPVWMGWFGTLLAVLPFECPPKWCRAFMTIMAGGIVGTRFGEVFSYPAENKGEKWIAHLMGFVSGLVFGLLHFGAAKFCSQREVAFGTFKGFEKKARDAGTPWPGYCRFFWRLLLLSTFDCGGCCSCCMSFKAAADEKAVEMQKW